MQMGEIAIDDEIFDVEALAGVDRFVLSHTPLRADGATSSSAPALAIAALP